MKTFKIALLISLSAVLSTACSSFQSANSPDVIYDKSALAARDLQIPPDLTDVSNAEQFVLPGTTGGAVSRNTLLPQFSNMRFERAGQQSWLAFDQPPEDVWPQLLAFVKNEKYLVFQTEPTSGLIVTQWRPASAVAKGNLLKNLIGGDEEYTRLLFRLERNGSGARVFARSQAASEDVATAQGSNTLTWPASSHDPETTSEALSSLLVFIGVEQQKARGIIDADQARLITQDALVLSTGSGSQLIVQRGFTPSFNAVLAALNGLEYPVTSSDDGVGRIEFLDGETTLVIEMTPQHVSEVRASLSSSEGRRLPVSREQELLGNLLEQILQG